MVIVLFGRAGDGFVVLGIDRGDQRVAEGAEEQDSGHDVEGDRVGIGLRDSVIDLILADVID